MSEWITDRLPTADDSTLGFVWITNLRTSFVTTVHFRNVNLLNEDAWQPITFINRGWITDREPTRCDCDDADDQVWTVGQEIYMTYYGDIRQGQPWQPVIRPEPYVKPKRFRVEYFEYYEEKSPGCYVIVTDFIDDDIIYHKTPLPYLTKRDAHKEAAERIAAIYEEMFP